MNKSILISTIFAMSLLAQPVHAFDIGTTFEHGARTARRFTNTYLTKILVGALIVGVGYKVGKFCKKKWDEHTNKQALETIKKIQSKYEEAFKRLNPIIPFVPPYLSTPQFPIGSGLPEAELLKIWSEFILNENPNDHTFKLYLDSIHTKIKKLETIEKWNPAQYPETKKEAQAVLARMRQLERTIARFSRYLRAVNCLNETKREWGDTVNQILNAPNQGQQECNLHAMVRKYVTSNKKEWVNSSKYKYINFGCTLLNAVKQLQTFSQLPLNDNLQAFAQVQHNINAFLVRLNDVLALLTSTDQYQDQQKLYEEEEQRKAEIRRQQKLIEEQNRRMEQLEHTINNMNNQIHNQNWNRFNR